MTKNEIVQKNIALSFDFVRHLLKDQNLLQEIPDYAEVEFVEHDLPVSTGAERSEEQCKTVLFKVEHTFREMSDPRWSAKSVNE